MTILLIVLLVLLLGGGGYGYTRGGWGASPYGVGGGMIGLIVLVLLIVFIFRLVP